MTTPQAGCDDFPMPAIYISESGGDSRVGGDYSGSLTVTGNVLIDNWSGVIVYQMVAAIAVTWPPASPTGSARWSTLSGVLQPGRGRTPQRVLEQRKHHDRRELPGGHRW